MEQKTIIWITAAVLGVAALGCLIWLVIWFVNKDKEVKSTPTAATPAAATPLVSSDDCKTLAKTLWERTHNATNVIESAVLQKMVADVLTGIPVEKAADIKVNADMKKEEEVTAWLQDNLAAALLLKQATDAFVALDKDKSGELNADELKGLTIDDDGDVLVALMDVPPATLPPGYKPAVNLKEWMTGLSKGYFKNVRNLMWVAGGDDHTLTAEELTKALVWVTPADAKTASGTDNVFDLVELVTFVVKGMKDLGLTAPDATSFDKDDLWIEWVWSSVAKLAKADPKKDEFEIAKLKDNGIDVPADTGKEKVKEAEFKSLYQVKVLKAMGNPGTKTA